MSVSLPFSPVYVDCVLSVVVCNSDAILNAKVRHPVDSLWANAWVGQIIHITSVDDRVSQAAHVI